MNESRICLDIARIGRLSRRPVKMLPTSAIYHFHECNDVLITQLPASIQSIFVVDHNVYYEKWDVGECSELRYYIKP